MAIDKKLTHNINIAITRGVQVIEVWLTKNKVENCGEHMFTLDSQWSVCYFAAAAVDLWFDRVFFVDVRWGVSTPGRTSRAWRGYCWRWRCCQRRGSVTPASCSPAARCCCRRGRIGRGAGAVVEPSADHRRGAACSSQVANPSCPPSDSRWRLFARAQMTVRSG